ncbi:MAG: hypothetical protein WCG28_04680, partial [bacterium]
MKFILNKKILTFFTVIVFILFFSKTVFAIWNNTFYEPGGTLNPECLPTDLNCDVRSPLTGLITIGTANGLSLSAQALSLDLASTSTTGALSSTDWNTFNGLTTLKADVGQTFYIGTTQVPINRTSGTLNLEGVNIDGNAGTVTNGVYTNSANSFSLINPLTTLAESWIGPSSTAGIYFKGGNVGIGTTTPSQKLEVNGNILVNKGTTNRTAYLSDDGLYMSRTSDGLYKGSIVGDGGMTFSASDGFSFITNLINGINIDNGGIKAVDGTR